ncbi:heme exporter protein B [Arcticibacter tournemirensis]|uniref:ABC transporter permease n=1 Tax=Arcticibacter tournemirensis TaxID=699437 RepID=A0A4Q0M9M4_9SPHI|nr:heme exporter protein CcmB [Arcticibacter tournemirensis]KAA8484404.1 ABC transporter permease [Arcticibacter tournemirensis]RXF69785.1 ABC transporter permease [Arcticibacter tournemirensis]TQM49846.1 heme exporter protein B [Arcticibacter tournemirensis]
MDLLGQVRYLIKKEIVLEWRSKYALNGILLYVVSTIFVCYLSFKQINPVTWNALFWIIMLFASVNAIAKSFLQENKGRQLYYYSIASARAIIISKIVYNILLMLLLSVIAIAFYSLVFNNPIGDPLFYLLSVLAGSISFASVFTMISGIASKANNSGALMAILSFPVIIPLLIVLIKFSKNAMDGLDRSVSLDEIGVLLAINIIVITISLLLFPFLWRD